MHTKLFMRMSKGGWPSTRSKPTQTPWMEFGELTVERSLWVGDPHRFTSESGLTVKLPRGTYEIQARGMDFAGHRRISRLRVVPAGKATGAALRRGRRIGEVAIDSSTVSVCDLAAVEENLGAREDVKLQRMLIKATRDVCGQLKIELDNKAEFDFAFTTSGLGDGAYPVFQLTRGGRTAGVEIVFMGREAPQWKQQIELGDAAKIPQRSRR